MKTLLTRIGMVLMVLALSACAGGIFGPTATSTTDTFATEKAQVALDAQATGTAEAQAALATEQAEAAAATQAAQETQAAVEATASQATANAQATTDAEMAAKTATIVAVETAKANRAATQTSAAATSVAVATAAAQPIALIVADLQTNGVLSGAEGEFKQIPAFDEEWAQLGWYRWWRTGENPKNFVIRADAFFETASRVADWYVTGCGYVFHLTDQDHYVAFLGMDGYANLAIVKNNNWGDLGRKYFGRMDTPADSANLMLVVEEDMIYFYVDDVQVIRASNNSLTKGDLALTLLSGTNKDFGTHCKMTNISLWTLP